MGKRADYWAFTFASGRELSKQEQREILSEIDGYSIGIAGKVTGVNRWDYNVYTGGIGKTQFTEEDFKYLQKKGLVVFMPDDRHSDLVNRVFSDVAKDLKALRNP